MIDSPLPFVASTSAPPTTTKSSANAPAKNKREEPDFSDVLAKSAEQATENAEHAVVRDEASTPSDRTWDENAEPDVSGTVVISGAELATLIAQVRGENLLIAGASDGTESPDASAGPTRPVPIGRDGPATPAAPGIAVRVQSLSAPEIALAPEAPATLTSAATPILAAPLPAGPLPRGYAKVPAGNDPVDATPGLIAPAEEPSVAVAAIAKPEVALVGRSPQRQPSADAIGLESRYQGQAAQPVGELVAHSLKPDELRNSGSARKPDDVLPPLLRLEIASPVNLAGIDAPQAANTRSAGPSGTATLLVPTHVDSPAWSKDFGQHVIRLANEGRPAAEIHLNPPELGPIRVSIELKDQGATLQFSAEHLQTREALEAALPRLREMFAGNNLTLTGASVSAGSFSQHFSGSPQHAFDQSPSSHGNGRTTTTDTTIPAGVDSPRQRAGASRVDLFA